MVAYKKENKNNFERMILMVTETKKLISLNDRVRFVLTEKGKEFVSESIRHHVMIGFLEKIECPFWGMIHLFGEYFMTMNPNTIIDSILVQGEKVDFNQKVGFSLTEDGVSIFKEKLKIEYRTHEVFELPLWVLLYALSDIAKTHKPSPIKDNAIYL